MTKLYMAYNHNGTHLLENPSTKKAAKAEIKEYMFQTGNKGSYVSECDNNGEEIIEVESQKNFTKNPDFKIECVDDFRAFSSQLKDFIIKNKVSKEELEELRVLLRFTDNFAKYHLNELKK